MLIVDSHLDIAFNALDWNRDLTRSITSIRESEAGMARKGRGAGVVNFAELRRGGIGLIFVTVHCRLASVGRRFAGVRTQDIAYAKAMGELAYYRRMEARGFLRQIRDRAGLDAHLAAWEREPGTTPIGFVLTMEGADPIVGPEQVGEWWDHGLRIVSLVHYGISSYAHGTQAPGGLTGRGGPMLDELERAGMLLDVSHLAERVDLAPHVRHRIGILVRNRLLEEADVELLHRLGRADGVAGGVEDAVAVDVQVHGRSEGFAKRAHHLDADVQYVVFQSMEVDPRTATPGVELDPLGA